MSIVLTKIKIPQQRKDILRRQRLIDLLHQNIFRKLIFVSAPAGYGKTTLLAEFAHDIDANVFWYRVDRDDVDIVPFVIHFILSFQQTFPEFGKEILPLLEAGGSNLDPNGLGVELVNEMVRHVNDFCVLFLDDYHLVGERQAIVDMVETILTYLPDQVRVVIASRSVFGIPSANLYLRNDLATISAEELKFRTDELKALVSTHSPYEIPEEQLEEMAKRSDGWIIAILLAIRALEQGVRPQFQESGGQMYDFLAKEVIDLQPDYLRQFLLYSSVLDEFNEGVCNELLEITNSAELIQELEDRNLFLTRIEGEHGTTNFRYHQLFNEFLSQRLADTDLDTKIKLHRKAANWYYKRQLWEKAVHHKLEAGDRVEAAKWMDQFASQLFITGRISVISDWIQNLASPIDVRGKAPWLALNWAKVLYERGDYSAGDQFLDIAEFELENKKAINQLISLYVTRGMGRVYQGQPKKALELAQTALGTADTYGCDKHYRFQADRLMGMACRHLGRTADSVLYLDRAANGFREIVSLHDQFEVIAIHDLAETLNDLGIAHFENGDILAAQKYLEEVISIRRKQKSNMGALVIALNNVGYLYYLLGRYREAWKSYEEAYTIAISLRHHRGMVHILNSRGDLLRDLGEWKSAEASYLEARRRAESADNSALFATYTGLSELERRRGNFHDSLYWLREAARIRNQSIDSPDYLVGLGQVYLDMGQVEMAKRTFHQALDHLKAVGRPNQNLSLAYFLNGCASYSLGDNSDAVEKLIQSLVIAAQLGYDQFLVVASKTYHAYVHFVSEKDKNPQLLSIVQRVNNFPDFSSLVQSHVEIQASPKYDLDIIGFGKGTVYKNGELITVSDWRSTNARGLFFYIIDRGGIRKDEIALELWPDFTQAKATSNFHSTLWRVRKALDSKDGIIFDENKYLLHPSINYQYDVLDFESYINRANGNHVSQEKQIDLYRAAIDLYKDDFLIDQTGLWVENRRNELSQTFELALVNFAKLLEQGNNYSDARRVYEQILTRDPYRDDIHLAIMHCMVKTGMSSAAKAHYQKYKEFLWKELQAKPQIELQEFYNSLD